VTWIVAVCGTEWRVRVKANRNTPFLSPVQSLPCGHIKCVLRKYFRFIILNFAPGTIKKLSGRSVLSTFAHEKYSGYFHVHGIFQDLCPYLGFHVIPIRFGIGVLRESFSSSSGVKNYFIRIVT
jgi:hypothetical protein